MAKDITPVANSIYEILDSYKVEIKEKGNGVTVYVCKQLKSKKKYKQNQRKEENDLV
jgi:hypothetical protein